MRRYRKTERGAAILLAILGISAATFIFLAATSRAVISQKNLARKLWNRQQFNALLNPWISRVMNDLQVAVHYPEAVDLPGHPVKAANGVPCATKDAPENGVYTLDAFLLPANQPCPIPIEPTTVTQEPYWNNYPAEKKTYSYPKGLLTVDFFKNNVQTSTPIIAQTDPQVTIERLGSTAPRKYLYRVSLSMNVCDVPVSASCPAGELRALSYSSIVNVNTDFFQGGSGNPPINQTIPTSTCGDLTQPFTGTFVSDSFDLGIPGYPVQTFSANLNQTGTALTGNWAVSSNLSGSLSGTISGNDVNSATMTWSVGCTGTLMGNLNISEDGCTLSGTFSGNLSGEITNPEDGTTVSCSSPDGSPLSLDITAGR